MRHAKGNPRSKGQKGMGVAMPAMQHGVLRARNANLECGNKRATRNRAVPTLSAKGRTKAAMTQHEIERNALRHVI